MGLTRHRARCSCWSELTQLHYHGVSQPTVTLTVNVTVNVGPRGNLGWRTDGRGRGQLPCRCSVVCVSALGKACTNDNNVDAQHLAFYNSLASDKEELATMNDGRSAHLPMMHHIDGPS